MGEEYSIVLKIIQGLGVPGLVTYVIYRLLDKYLGRFLSATEMQANAIQELAAAVKESASDQREVVMAVRVLTSKVEESMGWMKEIGQQIGGGTKTA